MTEAETETDSSKYSSTRDLLRLFSIEHKLQADLRRAISWRAAGFLNRMAIEWNEPRDLLKILILESKLSDELRQVIHSEAKWFLGDVECAIGKFLCRVGGGELTLSCTGGRDEDENMDILRTLVQVAPNAMEFDSSGFHGMYPINCALDSFFTCGNVSILPLILLLAEEGTKHNIGGESLRGGLMRRKDWITMPFCSTWPHEISLRHLELFRRLYEMGLLKKEDIAKFGLLEKSRSQSRILSEEWFKFFAGADPNALKSRDGDGKCILHRCKWPRKDSDDKTKGLGDYFELTLMATLRHHPRELGLLLLKDSQNKTPMGIARETKGDHEAWQVIRKSLDRADCRKMFEKDASTNLFPFMLAALEGTNQLDLFYYLGRKNPLLLTPQSS